MRKKNKAKVKIKTSRVTRKRPVGRKKSPVVVKKKRKKSRKQEVVADIIFDSNKGLTDSLFVADENEKNNAIRENNVAVFATPDVVETVPDETQNMEKEEEKEGEGKTGEPEEIISSMPDIDQKNKQEREKGILEKIFSFAKYSFRNLFSSMLIGLIFAGLFSAIFYALALPYAPGETTNPTCSPGDTNCTVTAAVPYTGATAAVDLGAKNFATTGTGSFAGLTLTTSALTVGNGGIGLSTIAAGSILGANTLDTLTAITSTSGAKVLTNTAGTITWETSAVTSPGGSDTHVQFNNASAFGGEEGFTYNSSTDYATLVGGLVAPTIIGGAGTTSDLNLKTTSGVGASGADMHFLVGNNGATEAMTILNSGNVGIGTTGPTNLLHIN